MYSKFFVRCIAVLLALLCQFACYGQQTRLDSAKNALPYLSGNNRVDCLNLISEAYRELRFFHTSRAYAQEAAAIARQSGYIYGKGVAYYNLAATGFDVRGFASIEKECDTAINSFEKMNVKAELTKAYLLLGRILWAQSKFDRAQNAFLRANRLAMYLGDTSAIGTSFANIALLEEERGNYERSFQYALKALRFNDDNAYIALGQLYADAGDYETALDYYNKIRDKDQKTYSFLKVGEVHYLKNEPDSAIYYYNLFIRKSGGIARKILPKPYALLGTVYRKTGKYKLALFYLHSAFRNFTEEQNRNWTMRVLLELAKVYQANGNEKLAINYTQKLLGLAGKFGAKQYIRDGNYLLYQLYDVLQKADSAYVHLKRYTDYRNSTDIDMSARKLFFYKISNERTQAQLKIDLLNKQRQLEREHLNRSTEQRRFLLIGLFAFVIIGLILFRNMLLKKKNEKHLRELTEHELKIQKLESKKQLSELEMQVLRTQMNPHFLFNSLNSINRFILRSNRIEASEYLNKFSRLVRMILQNSQSKMITLTQELESLQLYLSLEALRFDHHFTYRIKVDKEVDTDVLKVPPLIIQPYVENAVWHGLMHKEDKGEIKIEILADHDVLLLKITDDGVGREKSCSLTQKPGHRHKPMGLGITSQRIEMIQDTVSDEPAVVINDLTDPLGYPCGTEVIIKLPLIYD